MILSILSTVTSIFSAVTSGTTGTLSTVAGKIPISFYAGLVVGLVITENHVRADALQLAKDALGAVI